MSGDTAGREATAGAAADGRREPTAADGERAVSLAVPAHRRDALAAVRRRLLAAQRIALTTHVNADGDGAGSEIALGLWLASVGRRVAIVNPTPYPAAFRFLADPRVEIADAATTAGRRALDEADLLAVLDTGEPRRIGRVAPTLKRLPAVVIDHHQPSPDPIEAVGVWDPDASATGELIYDLFRLAEEEGGGEQAWPLTALEAIYTAIVTDTGSFRFANTRPRTHAIVGDLLRRGVDPERMYRMIYGTVPLHRVRLLRDALEGLEKDPELPITWITIPADAVQRTGATADDFDGIIEHARSIENTEVALLFRQTADGATKVSFRSNGDLDVNALARSFGGGGHIKAAGALVGEALPGARDRVLEATRDAVRALLERRGDAGRAAIGGGGAERPADQDDAERPA